MNSKNKLGNPNELRASILNACKTQIGVLDNTFLCQSIGVLEPKMPITTLPSSTVAEVGNLLKENNVGCVLVCDSNDTLLGIFSERDYLTKIYNRGIDESSTKIEEFMTKDPITITPDSPIAYGLSVMAHGGFRHLPITDPDGMAIGIISVRDLMDYIVNTFVEDVLSLETSA